jgi:hypothetical protein
MFSERELILFFIQAILFSEVGKHAILNRANLMGFKIGVFFVNHQTSKVPALLKKQELHVKSSE